jgi:RES domain
VPAAVPGDCPGTANVRTIGAGTTLWRLHSRHRAPDSFNTSVNDAHLGGGRFSSTEAGRFPYLYVSFAADTALAERLLRDLPFDGGKRLIPRAAVIGRRVSMMELSAPVRLLSLVTAVDLARVCQDEWLVHTGPRDYGLTRRWAHWLRETHPWAQGLLWQSKRDLPRLTAMLFGDRCPGAVRPLPAQHHDLDDQAGTRWLNERLAQYGASVAAVSETDSSGTRT